MQEPHSARGHPAKPSALQAASLRQVLAGKKIIEVSGGLAGQHCGHALAELGASVTVIRVSAATSSPLDAGKTLRHIDPWTSEGMEALSLLCTDCDLFIEDRPPTGWPGGQPLHVRLMQRHPHMLAVCLSPFGLTGPYADYAAYPLNCYHAGGNAQQIPCDYLRPQDRQRPPLQAGGLWGEAQAGTLAALAGLAFVLDARAHAGTVIDCSRQEALISFNWTEVARFPNEARAPTRLSPLATIVGGILPTQDGFVQVAVREDHQWAALAQLLEHPEWAQDERFRNRAARALHTADISRLLALHTVRFATAQLHLRGREMGIPMGAVMHPSQLLVDVDLAARGAYSQGGAQGLKYPRWDASVSTRAASAGATAARPSAPGLPLKGLRVLDFGWVAMGPYAGYTLAGLGAEVIHVGRPPLKDASGVDLGAYNYGFDTLNTGKTWIGMDLKSPEGRELIHALVAQCDIVLDNFRPGVTRRLGIDFETLSAINPRLVMLSASTYGERAIAGPYVGYAPVFSALAGLAQFTGYPDGPPAEVSHPVDFYAGSVGILGIVAGLHRLAATGSGCHIDLSAREAILWSLSHEMLRFQLGQTKAERLGNGHETMAPHGVYRCRGENRWISIAVGSDEEWLRLCECMGHLEMARDDRFASARGRLAQHDLIDKIIGQWTQERDAHDLLRQLQAKGVAAFPSCTSQDLWNDEHIQARQVFHSRQADGAKRWYVGAPWNYPGQPRQPLHTVTGAAAIDAVFKSMLGLSDEQIQSLQSRGIVAAR